MKPAQTYQTRQRDLMFWYQFSKRQLTIKQRLQVEYEIKMAKLYLLVYECNLSGEVG